MRSDCACLTCAAVEAFSEKYVSRQLVAGLLRKCGLSKHSGVVQGGSASGGGNGGTGTESRPAAPDPGIIVRFNEPLDAFVFILQGPAQLTLFGRERITLPCPQFSCFGLPVLNGVSA